MDQYEKFFNSLNVDKNKFKKVQNRLLEMAKEVTTILDNNKIEYFIFYGTLLGAVRHKGFIPWDDDFDIYIMDDVYDKAIEILRANISESLLVEDAQSEKLFFHGWARIKDKNTIVHNIAANHDNLYSAKGLNLDVFRAKKTMLSENELHKFQEATAYYSRKLKHNIISETEFNNAIAKAEKQYKELQNIPIDNNREVISFSLPPLSYIEINELFPLQELAFQDLHFKAPAMPHGILKKCYGEKYMEPPSLEKINIHFSDVVFLDS
ncbi:MAG: LicD family protein [Eubacteriales bacterium]